MQHEDFVIARASGPNGARPAKRGSWSCAMIFVASPMEAVGFYSQLCTIVLMRTLEANPFIPVT